MTKKKKKAPAAQQLIESLLNEKSPYRDSLKGSKASSPFPASSSKTEEETHSESIELNLESLELPEDVAIENVRDLTVDHSSETHVEGKSESSGTFSVELDEDENGHSLKLDEHSGPHVLDPVAQAEKTAMIERTRVQAMKKPLRDEDETLGKEEFPAKAPQEKVTEDSFAKEFEQSFERKFESDLLHAVQNELESELLPPPPPAPPPAPPKTEAATEPAPEPERWQEPAPAPSVAEIHEEGSERTVRLQPAKQSGGAAATHMRSESTTIDRATVTEIRPGARASGRGGSAPSSAVFTSAEATLKQSESLRIAQARISDLEKELERLRRENEKLATAGETLKRRADELTAKSESVESHARESQRIFEEEKRVMRGQLTQKDRENAELRVRNEEMEARLESNFKKIRVRERELEHRLEIVKMESATLVATKDKMILELKRQIDQLTHETEYGKQRTQELFNQYKDKQETIRRVVRALRIALTILEGDEDSVSPLKKAE